MSLLDTISKIRSYLEENGSVSFRILRREFGLDDESLEDIVEDLVDMQGVARRNDKSLIWRDDSGPSKPTANPIPTLARPAPEPCSYTPKHLADKILQSRSALEGERKQVTVLFADVKGPMGLAEKLGAEEWHRSLDRFFAILAEGVHRYEGTINQYIGLNSFEQFPRIRVVC